MYLRRKASNSVCNFLCATTALASDPLFVSCSSSGVKKLAKARVRASKAVMMSNTSSALCVCHEMSRVSVKVEGSVGGKNPRYIPTHWFHRLTHHSGQSGRNPFTADNRIESISMYTVY